MVEDSPNTDMEYQRRYKRKRKDNFLRQTKSYAKIGKFGKGNQLSEEQYNYYINVFQLLNQVKGEEKEVLVENLLKGILEEEEPMKLIGNQVVSHILDKVLPFVETYQLLLFIEKFSQEIRLACLDPYVSHVLESILALSLKFIQADAKPAKDKKADEETDHKPIKAVTQHEKKEIVAFLNKVGRFVYNNLDEFIRDLYGSHVVRTLLEVCSGVKVDDSIKSSKRAFTKHSISQGSEQNLVIPSELQSLLLDLISRLMQLPDLPGVITSTHGSTTFQTALLVLQGIKSEQCNVLVDHVFLNGVTNICPSYLENYDETFNIPHVFQSNSAVRLFEVMVCCATSDQLDKFYENFFKGHIADMVQHPMANYTVQKILSSWQEKEKFHILFEEVKDALPAALTARNTGVVRALSQSCLRLGKCQGPCWMAITDLFKCSGTEEQQLALAPCLLRFQTFDEYQKCASAGQLPRLSLHGALILQDFLHFFRPMKVYESIMAMNFPDLFFMACDPVGCHVIDAIASSPFMKFATKERLINVFQDSYLKLACSKHGSRSLENMWKISSIKVRTAICAKLANKELELKDNPYGKIIYTNFQVNLFSRNKLKDWQEVLDSAAKKKRQLENLLDDVNEEEPKNKKNKKTETSVDKQKKKKVSLEDTQEMEVELTSEGTKKKKKKVTPEGTQKKEKKVTSEGKQKKKKLTSENTQEKEVKIISEDKLKKKKKKKSEEKQKKKKQMKLEDV